MRRFPGRMVRLVRGIREQKSARGRRNGVQTRKRIVVAARFCKPSAMSEKRDVHFPTTHWTLMARMRSGDASEARRALDDMLAQYRYTLYAFIRRRGLSHHDAEDALQDFLVRLLNAQSLLAADAKRGRLRGFLSVALGHFLSNWKRGEARREKLMQELPGTRCESEEERYAKEQFTTEDTAEQIFERKWGHALMSRVMEQLKKKCEENGKGALFAVLRPVLVSGGSLRGHDAAALAARLGMNEGALRVALLRHLRDYRKVLEEEVAQTVEDPKEIPEEIAHLIAIFSSGPGKSDASRGAAMCE